MMIVVMQPGASFARISAVVAAAEKLGFRPRPSHGAEQTLVGVIGAGPADDLAGLAALPGVERVSPVSRSFKLVSREFQPQPTRIRLGANLEVGGEEFVVMAGPCAVESKEQIEAAAAGVVASGATVLRGGAYKPRTSPYSFQGLGVEGLRYLEAAGAANGLATVTEVISPELVETVARHASILQVGARNMQNYALLEAVGKSRTPVLLKRGLMSTIEEQLLAAEYILSHGNSQVMLCERGIRTFERATRNTLDISAVAVIKEQSHLPVIVDPSHASGHRPYIPALARAAAAAGADGIIVEVHPNPEEALSDGPQSFTFEGFSEMMDGLRPVVSAVGRRLREGGDASRNIA